MQPSVPAVAHDNSEDEFELDTHNNNGRNEWHELALRFGVGSGLGQDPSQSRPEKSEGAEIELSLKLGLGFGDDCVRKRGSGLEMESPAFDDGHGSSSSSLPPPPLQKSSSSPVQVNHDRSLDTENPPPVASRAPAYGHREGAGIWFRLLSSR